MLAVTVDIEDWYHTPSVTGSPFSKFRDVDEFFVKWNQRYDYLTEPTKRVLEILDELNLCATFFVVADVTEHYPGLVEQIASRGHEIACHGLHHACKIHPKTKEPLISQSEFEERTLQAKKMLEELVRELQPELLWINNAWDTTRDTKEYWRPDFEKKVEGEQLQKVIAGGKLEY